MPASFIQTLQSPRLLIIDESGNPPLSAKQVHELFKVIAVRYEKDCVLPLLTSNLNLGQWDQALDGNSSLATETHFPGNVDLPIPTKSVTYSC